MPKISQYPPMSALTGSEVILGNQTGVTATATATQIASLAQGGMFAVDSGVANAYVLTAKTLPALQANQMVIFNPLNANTGASTANLNGKGASIIVDSQGNPLSGGEISGPVILMWTGSQWQLQWILPIANKKTAAEVVASSAPGQYSFLASSFVDVRRYMTNAQLADFNAHQIDGNFTVDQTSAVNLAIKVCSWNAVAGDEWAPLMVPGRLLINPSTGPMIFGNGLVGGSGYVNGTYTAVPLTGGTGSNASATIVVAGGVVTSVTVTGSGTGYTVGNTLSASAANLGGSGSGFSVNVQAISAVNIDRLVNTTSAEFRIVGMGPGAGFYTKANIVVFDSSLAYIAGGVGNNPPSEFVSFEDLQFETSLVSNASFVMTGKFLRVRYKNCRFFKLACVSSITYGQTIYWSDCNIRNCLNGFAMYFGTYDISFLHNIIENNNVVFRSVDALGIGTNMFRFVCNLMEGGQAISIQVTGFTGVIAFNYFEAQVANDINFNAGAIQNVDVVFQGNSILNPLGPTCSWGPVTALMSGGNRSNSGTSVSSGGVSITSGTAALTVLGASFTAQDVGKVITVPGAGPNGNTLVAVISVFTSGTQVTLNSNASSTLAAVAEVVQYSWPIHGNAIQVADGVSLQDTVLAGAVADAPFQSLINGVLRFGGNRELWSGQNNELTKDLNGNMGVNTVPLSTVKFYVFGKDQTSTAFAAAFADSAGNTIFAARNDRQLQAPALTTATGTALVLDGTGMIKQLSSSRRFKKDIQPIDIGLDFILSLHPVMYNLIEGDVPQVGFIAEDFPEKRLVNLSRIDPDDPEKGMQPQSVNYQLLIAPLVQAVQELTERVKMLEKANAAK